MICIFWLLLLLLLLLLTLCVVVYPSGLYSQVPHSEPAVPAGCSEHQRAPIPTDEDDGTVAAV